LLKNEKDNSPSQMLLWKDVVILPSILKEIEHNLISPAEQTTSLK